MRLVRRRTIPLGDFHKLPGDHPARRKRAGPGRTHYGGDIAQAGWRDADLPQGSRPGFLRVRARLGGRGDPTRWHRSGGGRRHRAPALASRGGGRGVAARGEGGGRAPARGAKPTDDNKFKLKLVERTLGAVLAEAKEQKLKTHEI